MTCIDMKAKQLFAIFVSFTKQFFKIVEFFDSLVCTGILDLMNVFWQHVVLTLEERFCSLAVTLCKWKIVHVLLVVGSERLILVI